MKKMMQHYPSASAKLNDRFMLIMTRYGCPGGLYDYSAASYFFSPDTEDNIGIGHAVLSALKASRPVSRDEFDDIYALSMEGSQYNDFFSGVMKRFEYKTKRALFKEMRSVSIMIDGQNIKLSPSKHVKLQAWGREKGDGIEDVIIPFTSEPAEVGQALRLAFSRCK